MNHTLAFPIFEKDLNTFYGNACIVEFERINTNTQVNNADLCSLHTHTHTHTHARARARTHTHTHTQKMGKNFY